MLKRLKAIVVLFSIIMGLGAGAQAADFYERPTYDDQPHWRESFWESVDYYGTKTLAVGSGAYLIYSSFGHPNGLGAWEFTKVVAVSALFWDTLRDGFLKPYGII